MIYGLHYYRTGLINMQDLASSIRNSLIKALSCVHLFLHIALPSHNCTMSVPVSYKEMGYTPKYHLYNACTYVCVYVSAGKVTIVGGSSITYVVCMHARSLHGFCPCNNHCEYCTILLLRSSHAPVYTCIHVFMHTVVEWHR